MDNTSDAACEQVNLQKRKLRHKEVMLKGCLGRTVELSLWDLWLDQAHSISLGVSIQRPEVCQPVSALGGGLSPLSFLFGMGPGSWWLGGCWKQPRWLPLVLGEPGAVCVFIHNSVSIPGSSLKPQKGGSPAYWLLKELTLLAHPKAQSPI